MTVIPAESQAPAKSSLLSPLKSHGPGILFVLPALGALP
jgi:hypothetical protein